MKRVTSIGAAITILFSVSCKENKQNATENSEKAQPAMELHKQQKPLSLMRR